jgi:hypothetical protein
MDFYKNSLTSKLKEYNLEYVEINNDQLLIQVYDLFVKNIIFESRLDNLLRISSKCTYYKETLGWNATLMHSNPKLTERQALSVRSFGDRIPQGETDKRHLECNSSVIFLKCGT